jgi:hypothetical protein
MHVSADFFFLTKISGKMACEREMLRASVTGDRGDERKIKNAPRRC